MIGMLCIMLSSLLFGFSRSLAWAIAARAFAGSVNGNVGIIRTTVAELVPQARTTRSSQRGVGRGVRAY